MRYLKAHSGMCAATARRTGIGVYALRYRVREKGMSLSEAVERHAEFYLTGPASITQQIRAAGIAKSTFYDRISRGMSIEAALAAARYSRFPGAIRRRRPASS